MYDTTSQYDHTDAPQSSQELERCFSPLVSPRPLCVPFACDCALQSAWRSFCHSPTKGAYVLKEKLVTNFVLPGSGFYATLRAWK